MNKRRIRMRIDALAQLFFDGLSVPAENKGIGVVKPRYTQEEYIIVRIGDTDNNDGEQGGIHKLRDNTHNETWYKTEVFLDIIIIEPHDLDGRNTYELMATALERTKQEVRNLNMYHRDFETVDWWVVGASAPDLSDGEAKTQVIQSTLSVIVEWAEVWQVGT